MTDALPAPAPCRVRTLTAATDGSTVCATRITVDE